MEKNYGKTVVQELSLNSLLSQAIQRLFLHGHILNEIQSSVYTQKYFTLSSARIQLW